MMSRTISTRRSRFIIVDFLDPGSRASACNNLTCFTSAAVAVLHPIIVHRIDDSIKQKVTSRPQASLDPRSNNCLDPIPRYVRSLNLLRAFIALSTKKEWRLASRRKSQGEVHGSGDADTETETADASLRWPTPPITSSSLSTPFFMLSIST